MQLLKYFKELTLHPKNANELKDLILQLAVQGKLTAKWREENPNVEPASLLLEKIMAEKVCLIKDKKIKGSNKLHQKAKKTPSFEIPASWEHRRFWDVIWCFRGHNPPKSVFIDEPREGYVRFVQITDFKTNTRAVYVPESYKLKRVYKGEILMAAYRHIGKLSREMEGAFNVALCKVNCIEPFDIDFLELLIGTPIVKGELLAESERGHIPSMHSDHLLSLWIPVPPLAEQKVIVTIVNQLFAEVEQLEALTKERIQLKEDFATAALKQLSTTKSEAINGEWAFLQAHFATFFTEKPNIKKLRESILQLAVQGKLTYHWRTLRQAQGAKDEDASVLLEKIKAEKEQLVKEKKIKKSRSTDTIIEDNCVWRKPDIWEEIELQDIFKFIDYRGKTPTKSDSGKRLITAKNIRMGFIKNDPIEFVTDDFYKNWMVRGFPKNGDILFVTEGHTMGFIAQIDLKYEFALAQRTICFQSYLEMDLTFYYYALMSTQFQQIVRDNQTGSAAGGIKASKLKRIPIPLPPITEQQAIVEKVNALMTLCDQLEQEKEQGQQQAADLMRSCLREVVC